MKWESFQKYVIKAIMNIIIINKSKQIKKEGKLATMLASNIQMRPILTFYSIWDSLTYNPPKSKSARYYLQIGQISTISKLARY